MPTWLHHLPILTTVLAALFLVRLAQRYRTHPSTHLLWYAFGIATFGLGTALESAITLAGNGPWLNKLWYAAGAVLGGYPLAQGTVHLLCAQRTARRLDFVTVPIVNVLVVLVLASPVVVSELEPHRPTGAVLGWSWLRLMTPLVNGYAALFLIGGAVLSAVRHGGVAGGRHRAVGNAAIALGALLPGIGGAMAKGGVVEALYVGELVGLALIWWGYAQCVRPGADS
ncbi:MAG: hypothetical protein AB7O97_05955 [Planctomycetota bacterium]